MAYFSSTAASSVQNPPQLVYGGAGARTILGTSNMTAWSSSVTRSGGVQVWRYNSTNLTTDLVVAGFFTDGYYLGMQIGDLLFGTQWTSAGSSFISYAGVLTTTNSTAGFNLSTGGTMTSTFN
jgi:hypothetical protein